MHRHRYCFTIVADGVSFCLSPFDNGERGDVAFLEVLSLVLLLTGSIMIAGSIFIIIIINKVCLPLLGIEFS